MSKAPRFTLRQREVLEFVRMLTERAAEDGVGLHIRLYRHQVASLVLALQKILRSVR